VTDCPFEADYIHLVAKSVRDGLEDLHERLGSDPELIEAEMQNLASAQITLATIIQHFNTRPVLRVVK
jgi:hypothetical protein